jgi:hypothetical protein
MGLLKVAKQMRDNSKADREAMAENPNAWNAGQLTASAVLSLYLSGPKADMYAAAFKVGRNNPEDLAQLVLASLREEGIPRFAATLQEAEHRAPTVSEIRVFSLGYNDAFFRAVFKLTR